jgi:hypothetical protein
MPIMATKVSRSFCELEKPERPLGCIPSRYGDGSHRARSRRFGSASRPTPCRVRSNTLSGKPMLGSWCSPHASVGMTSAPICNTRLSGSPLGRRQSGLPAKCLCSATLLAACLLLASGFNSFSSYCVKTEWQQKPSRLPTAEIAVAPSTWKRCLPVLALPNRGDPPRHGGESRASVRQIASGISVFRWTGRIDL